MSAAHFVSVEYDITYSVIQLGWIQSGAYKFVIFRSFTDVFHYFWQLGSEGSPLVMVFLGNKKEKKV